jgi:hypothetical protein
MAELRSYFKCYDPRFVAWALVAAAVTIGAAFLGRRFEPGTAPRLALAALEAATMGAVILGLVFRMRYLDELQRQIQFESLAVAFGVTGAAIQGWGFFEKAGLPRFEWGLWGWPFMAVVWAIAFVVVKRRYE